MQTGLFSYQFSSILMNHARKRPDLQSFQNFNWDGLKPIEKAKWSTKRFIYQHIVTLHFDNRKWWDGAIANFRLTADIKHTFTYSGDKIKGKTELVCKQFHHNSVITKIAFLVI